MLEHDAPPRDQVVDRLTVLLTRMLRPDAPVTEQTQLMDELGLSSSLGLELDEDRMATLGDLTDYITANSTAR